MASFTQAPVAPNSLPPATFISDRSQGFTDSTEPLASLFKGVGQIAMQGTAVADEAQQQNIKGQVDQGVNSIFNDAGFRTAGNSETGTPAELQDYAGQLDNTKKAYMSGALSQTGLNIRVDALSRQMRMNNPGYGDDIDKLIGGALNRSTANDLWKGLATQWQAEKTQGQHEQDKEDQMIKEFASDGKLYQAFPNWDQLVQKGQQPDRDEIIAKVGQVAAGQATVTAGQAMIKYQQSQREEDLNHTFDVAQQDVNQISKTFMQAGSAAGDLVNKIAITDPTKVSDSDLAGMAAQVEPVILQSKLQIEKTLLNPVYDKLTPVQKTDIENRAMAPIQGMKDAITNRDTGFFSLNNSLTQAGSDKVVSNLMQGDASDVFKMYQATNKLLGPVYANTFLSQKSGRDPTNPDQTNKDLLAAKISNMQLITGNKPLTDVVSNMSNANPGKQADPASVNKVITDTTNILTDPNAKIDGKIALAHNIFSDDNADFLTKFSASKGASGVSDRMLVFNKLTSPAMSQSVGEMAKTDPDIAKKYQNTLFAGFQGLFKSKIDNEVSANQYSSAVGFKFNPQTFQIEEVAKPQAGASPGVINGNGNQMPYPAGSRNPNNIPGNNSSVYDLWRNSSQRSDMQDVNKFLGNFKQAMVNTGQDPNTAVEELFKNTGVLDGGHPPTSMFSQIGSAVMSGLGKVSDAMNKTGLPVDGMPAQQGMIDSKKQALDDQMTSLFGQGHTNGMEGDPHQELRDYIGKSEGADYNTLEGGQKVPLTGMSIDHASAIAKSNLDSGASTSTAMGKYQVVDSTLHEAMDALGIKGSDKFDAKTQDRIANWIIDNRAGGGTDPAKLAGVWASLPKEPSGAGAYDGVNGNKAHANYAELASITGRK